MGKVIGYLVAFIVVSPLFAAAVLYGAFSWGYVLYCFWDWFLLPVFPAVGEIAYSKAVGLMYFISLFNISNSSENVKAEYKDGTANLVSGLLLPWITLLLGWFLTLWI